MLGSIDETDRFDRSVVLDALAELCAGVLVVDEDLVTVARDTFDEGDGGLRLGEVRGLAAARARSLQIRADLTLA